jgi:methyl-accepting chemotaxis protein
MIRGLRTVTRKVPKGAVAGERRRIKMIKPGFQYRFCLNFVGMSVLGIILGMLLVMGFYGIRAGYDFSMQLMYRETTTGPIKYATLVRLLWPPMVASAIITCIISVWLGIRFSHRIAGPMYRFEKTFRDIRNGERVTHVHLRRHDEFKEVAHEFSRTLQWFWRRMKGR